MVTGPVVSHPERRTFSTAAISSSPIEGTWNGTYDLFAIFFLYLDIVMGVFIKACLSRPRSIPLKSPCGARSEVVTDASILCIWSVALKLFARAEVNFAAPPGFR
jgi:hypothetical protein